MKGKTGKIIAEFHGRRAALEAGDHAREIRRCRACGVRKVLDRGFYRAEGATAVSVRSAGTGRGRFGRGGATDRKRAGAM